MSLAGFREGDESSLCYRWLAVERCEIKYTIGAGGFECVQSMIGNFSRRNSNFVECAFIGESFHAIVGVANEPTFTHEEGATNAAYAFGGDPDSIVALTFSAGSSQTLDQITRYGGNAEQLFARAYLTSPGTVPGAGHQQVEAFWQHVSTTVGCSGGGLDCMRAVNYTTLNTAATDVISLYSYTLQPRVNGDIISDTYEAEFYAGHYNSIGPLVITHELPEKNSDVTSGIDSTADFPGITDTVINQILALYPESDYASPGLRFSDIEQSFELTSHNLALTNGLHNQTWNAMVALGEATHGTDQDYYWYSTYALSGDTQTSPVNATTARIVQNTNGVEIVFNPSMYLQADSLANAKSRSWNKALWY
ncbi:hypothetical protein EAF00_004007 [Botryotinia globosa]|nr:hypothetical protein EAF00_004007 [Botryotinia globosa]